jgi:hypothetical protein
MRGRREFAPDNQDSDIASGARSLISTRAFSGLLLARFLDAGRYRLRSKTLERGDVYVGEKRSH